MSNNRDPPTIELENLLISEYPNLDDSLPDLPSAPESENLRPQYLVTDFVTDIHQLSRFSLSPEEVLSRTSSQKKFQSGFHILNPSLWLVLMLTGLFSGLAAFIIDYTSTKAAQLHKETISYFEFWGGYGIWIAYALLFGALAASVGQFISSEAQGSGIPEMKTIISGTKIFNYLSMKAFLAKGIGLIAATGAGLSIGKEGPFVHLSAMIGHNLCKYFRCFEYIYKDPGLHLQILAAAVAAGVAATFGAPVGGVLFSIEVTASYYLVSNMWKAFFCAGWCSVVYNILRVTDLTDLVTEIKFYEIELRFELISFAVLGIVCGILGAGFIWVTKHILINKNKGNFWWFGGRYSYTLTVVLICGLICYPFKFLMTGDKSVINLMFNDEKFPHYEYDTLLEDHSWLTMLTYIMAKLPMTALSITTPIPCGVFTPIFTAGSVIGRLYGEIAAEIYGTTYQAIYAMVGAACLTSTVTHTLSVAIIVFELTGEINYLSYMLIGVLFSYAVGYALTPSIFDTLLLEKGLPYLPILKASRLYNKSAGHIMDRSFPFLLVGRDISHVCQVICGADIQLRRIPVIDEERNLIGDLGMGAIREQLYKQYTWFSSNLSVEAKLRLEPFFESLDKISKEVLEYDTHWANPEYENWGEEDASEKEFWKMPFNFYSPDLDLDRTPMITTLKAPLVKVHYLFLMLGLFEIYVTYRGIIVGAITKEDLIKIKH